jgi:ankyrin repeat protein
MISPEENIALSEREIFDLMKALESDNIDTIKGALLFSSYLDLSQPITVYDRFLGNKAVSIIEILFSNNDLSQDVGFFRLAKFFLDRGAPIPAYRKQKDYSTSEYLKYLSTSKDDLFFALYEDPSIVNLQDEVGKTILHHAASIGLVMGSNSASLIHEHLFQSKLIDFSIQDNEGNTPLHVAALYCDDRVTCDYVFPDFAREAARRNFDFSVLNTQGQAVIHLAAKIHYEHMAFGCRNTVAKLLEAVPDIDVNTLSSSGTSALYYAINRMHFREIDSLLSGGANPCAFARLDRSPISMVQKLIIFFEFLEDLSKVNIDDKNQLNKLCKKHKKNLTKSYIDQHAVLSVDIITFYMDYVDINLQEYAYELAGSNILISFKFYKAIIKALKSLEQRMESIISPKPNEKVSSSSQFWKQSAAQQYNLSDSKPIMALTENLDWIMTRLRDTTLVKIYFQNYCKPQPQSLFSSFHREEPKMITEEKIKSIIKNLKEEAPHKSSRFETSLKELKTIINSIPTPRNDRNKIKHANAVMHKIEWHLQTMKAPREEMGSVSPVKR